MTLGARIRAERERVGLTQMELADRLGWTRQRVWRLEHGDPPDPRESTVAHVADALGVPVDALVRPNPQ